MAQRNFRTRKFSAMIQPGSPNNRSALQYSPDLEQDNRKQKFGHCKGHHSKTREKTIREDEQS